MRNRDPNPSFAAIREQGGVRLAYRLRAAYPEALSRCYALVMLVLFPFVIGPEKYYAITKAKFVAFRFLQTAYTALAALLLLAIYLLDRRLRQARLEGGVQRPSLPQILLLAMLVSSCLSALLSDYSFGNTWPGMTRFEGLCSVFLYCGAFLLLSLWAEYSGLYLWGFAAAMTALCTIGILQPFGIDFLSPEGNYWGTRFFSTIGNIDVVSGLAALAAPMFACAYIAVKSRWRGLFLIPYMLLLYTQRFIDVDSGRIGLLAALAVCALLVCTDSERVGRFCIALACGCAAVALERFVGITVRGPALRTDRFFWVLAAAAAVLAACGLFLVLRQPRLPLTLKRRRLLLLALLLLLLIAACVLLYRYDGQNPTLRDFSQLLHGELTDSAGTYRGYIWKSSIALVRERPLFGSGPGTFAGAFEPYNDRYAELVNDPSIYVDFAHNDYLQIAVERGLVTLALHLAFLVSLAVRAIRRADRHPLLIVWIAGFAGYLTHLFFAFSIGILSPLFWVWAGILEKLIRQADEADAAP